MKLGLIDLTGLYKSSFLFLFLLNFEILKKRDSFFKTLFIYFIFLREQVHEQEREERKKETPC